MENDESSQLRARTLHTLYADDGSEITVEHVYLPEGAAGRCEECGGPAHDPGHVGLVIDDGMATCLLTPEEALVLANRLARAANLILESSEEPADVEREIARLGAATDGPS